MRYIMLAFMVFVGYSIAVSLVQGTEITDPTIPSEPGSYFDTILKILTFQIIIPGFPTWLSFMVNFAVVTPLIAGVIYEIIKALPFT